MTLQLTGIHHLTAITATRPENRFYTGTLGMRLVKKTVNQDDISAYHLFYGDGIASPGSDLTFFDWPAPRERRGTHAIVRTGLRVAGDATCAGGQDGSRAGVDDERDRERDGRVARLRRPRGPALQPRRRQRQGRGPSLGQEPGAGGASDPRPRPDHDRRARPRADRRGADQVMNMREARS